MNFSIFRWLLVAQAVVPSTGRVVAESLLSKHLSEGAAVAAGNHARTLEQHGNKTVEIIYVVRRRSDYRVGSVESQ